MTTRIDPFDDTIEVRVVLKVKVNYKAWATDMMGDHPREVTSRDVRAHVKDTLARRVAALSQAPSTYSALDTIPILEVKEG